MIRWALFATLVTFSAISGAHEEHFPLPLLAQGSTTSSAGDSARPSQPVGQVLPLKPTRTIDFSTDEGTWMSVDLSPDGRHIVFDLLGDLYEIDSAGGEARALTRGMGFDVQPTFSPDGQWIAFISDRSGADNVWVMRDDGSDLRQVSFGGDDTVLASPAWTPDGKSLYVSRFRWSLHNYELWRYELNGAEQLVVPIQEAGGNRKSSLGAVVSPDGRHVYFARRVGDASPGQLEDWSVVRREVATGAEETLVTEPNAPGRQKYAGAYFRPALSHDGNWMAYATRFDGQTGLRLRDLRTGADRWLAFPIEHDQIDAQSWQDLVPRYTFTPDDSAIILSRRGKLERLPVDEGAATPIPFTAKVELQLGPLTRVAVKEETGPVRARLIQTPEQSPDGQWLAFSALGHVYIMPLNGRGKTRRLTSSDTPEFQPSWSPDGRSIVFITWTAADAGQVWIAPLAGGEPRQITQAAAYYSSPVFAPDGQAVIALRSDNTARLHSMMEFGRQVREATLIAAPVAGGTARVVAKGSFGGKPHFSSDPNLAYLHTGAGLSSVHLATGEVKAFSDVRGPGWYFMDGAVPVDESRLSPDGKYLLVNIAQQLHVLATPAPGTTIDLSKPDLAHRRITDVGADFFEWADGGKTITWAVGSTFYRRPLADIKFNTAEQPDWTADAPNKQRTTAFKAVVEVPRDDPRGSLLLRGARVITMRGDEIIDGADILVRDGRIAAVGARGSIATPANVTVRDVAGKTIVPGLIDIHDHIADIRRDVLSLDAWGLRARLAYGITTAFDPSSLSIDMFAYQDLVDAGIVTGSRLRTTGMAMFSFNRLASVQEARALLTRYRDYYRTPNVKQYLIGNRMQRQWLAQAAAEMGVMPTTEGSLSLKLDLTQIMDGFSGSEHALPTPLYRDVVELVARSRTSYDGTLQIKNGGAGAQDNLVIRDRPSQDPKFTRSRPYYVVAQSALTRPWSEPSAMLYPRLGNDAARIQRAGGVVGMGSHGEIPGPGLHWEMEAHVHGGMTTMEALRAATVGSAEAIGRLHELGSIEVGKLADLVILDADPSADIRHSTSIDQVMKGGRLYDGDTLDELWPRQRVQPGPWFAGDRPALR
jgi:Tol biopolymer transport system component/predicted amidohydrolase